MEKRINQGYEIIQSIQVGSAEFVLGEHPKAPSRYVTWECKDKDNYFAGNYMNNLLAATKDLCERAMTQIEYLEEREIERNQKNKQRDRGEERGYGDTTNDAGRTALCRQAKYADSGADWEYWAAYGGFWRKRHRV